MVVMLSWLKQHNVSLWKRVKVFSFSSKIMKKKEKRQPILILFIQLKLLFLRVYWSLRKWIARDTFNWYNTIGFIQANEWRTVVSLIKRCVLRKFRMNSVYRLKYYTIQIKIQYTVYTQEHTCEIDKIQNEKLLSFASAGFIHMSESFSF